MFSKAVMATRPETIFLLSPATLSGERARQLASPDAGFETARRFRSPEGVPVGEAFSFMSSLYFRGKIAYARRFAGRPPGLGEGIFVILPGSGLVPPEWPLTREGFERLRRTPIDVKSRAYVGPLRAAARYVEERLGEGGRAVLLGSVATGKYVDVLRPVFGDRLLFPRCFAGVGDMARGALLLRAARSGEELDYATLDEPRHRRQEPRKERKEKERARAAQGGR